MAATFLYGSRGTHIENLQKRLKKGGFNPGGIDGHFGRGTAGAAAQAANALLPALEDLLGDLDVAGDIGDAVPYWLALAEAEIGVKEIAGDRDNPRIVEYQQATTLRATDDETPWCASYVAWVLEQAGIPSTRSARARSYEEWGTRLDGPVPGCIVVFWRGKKRSDPQGHVGFYVGGDPSGGRIAVLGGNQSDSVRISTYKTDRLIGYYWPEGISLPSGEVIARALAMDPGQAEANRWA